MIPATSSTPLAPFQPQQDKDTQLRAAAVSLEAAFLSEMLKSAGLGKPRDGFGGGMGEEQFSSFLRDQQSRTLAEGGGIGLAEVLFQAMKVRTDG